ncbi:NAD-dependent epimerase/dehydratase family protein [Salinibacter ruber]|uniref:NAD-dependent epimerase/dehydratase family protein n=1 Tax=Salinibacter ruber TaxID=146919 RepID=UPI00216991CD|nr:NAD-dependent epimerase/dehydratase family protein [Salinibacter ruber]MCS4150711.1 nucleoside-diphosphate-sugar epimerase [Salinibacter ruber]
MAVLVTGATGLVGRHLVDEVDGRVLAASRSKKHLGNSSSVEGVLLDLADEKTIQRLPWSSIDTVIHLAAYTEPRRSVEEPHKCFTTNACGTSALLTAAHDANVSEFLYLSSYWVFESGVTGELDESTPIGVETPYGASKLAAEAQCDAFRTQSEMMVTTLRPFNVYGPGARPHQVVPEFVSQATDAGIIEPHPGNPTRDFLYVEDLVDAIIACMKAKTDDVFNLGRGKGTSIRKLASEVADTVERLTDREVVTRFSGPIESSDKKIADIRKIRSRVGWTPKTDLSTGLEKLISRFL